MLKRLGIVVSVTLAACGPTLGQRLGEKLHRPYDNPASGALTDMTIANTTPYPVHFIIYEDAVDCRNRFWVRNVPGQGERTIKIPADRDVAFMMTWGEGNFVLGPYRECEVRVSFTPKDGGVYRAAWALGDDKCYLSVTDTTKRTGAEVTLTPRERSMPWGETGSFCEKLPSKPTQ